MRALFGVGPSEIGWAIVPTAGVMMLVGWAVGMALLALAVLFGIRMMQGFRRRGFVTRFS